jgi:PPOX class probable F420-dependent enzyme
MYTSIGDLNAERYVSLTTRRPNGTLASAPVWVVSDDGLRLLVWTGATTWKVRRIARDSRVFVAACDYRGRERGLRLPAHARTLDSGAAVVVDPLLRRKYRWQRRLLELRARLGRCDAGAVYLEIAPEDARPDQGYYAPEMPEPSVASRESAAQLAALGEVVGLFAGSQIDYWVFGGWAVDLHAGEITRSHGDIDLAVWLADIPTIDELLRAAGWTHVPSDDDDGGTGYERGGIRLELTFLDRYETGGAYTPLRDGRARWSEEALGNDVGELLGLRARVVGLAPLMRSKSRPRDEPDDAAKDNADLAVLTRLASA